MSRHVCGAVDEDGHLLGCDGLDAALGYCPVHPSAIVVEVRGRGRPALPDAERRRHRVPVWLTDDELARIEAARGEVERAVWLRERALRGRRAR